MLAARRCRRLGRVLAAALGECGGSGSSARWPQLATGPAEASLAAALQQLPGPTPTAAATAAQWRWYSQQPAPEAEPSQSAASSARGFAAAGAAGQEVPEEQRGYGGAEEEYREYEYEGEEQQAALGVDQERHALLEASLTHVARLGWSRAALEAGAAELGLSPSSAGILDRGAVELVEHFVACCNRQLEAELAARAEELAGLGTTARVREGVRLRLEMNVPYIDTWAQALSLQAQPTATARAVQQRAEIADIIWHAAGDRSTDYNWYTKRGLLTGVYGATELYMLTDASPGFADTWAALDRRLGDVLALGKVARSAAQVVQEAAAVLSSLMGAAAAGVPRRD